MALPFIFSLSFLVRDILPSFTRTNYTIKVPHPMRKFISTLYAICKQHSPHQPVSNNRFKIMYYTVLFSMSLRSVSRFKFKFWQTHITGHFLFFCRWENNGLFLEGDKKLLNISFYLGLATPFGRQLENNGVQRRGGVPFPTVIWGVEGGQILWLRVSDTHRQSMNISITRRGATDCDHHDCRSVLSMEL